MYKIKVHDKGNIIEINLASGSSLLSGLLSAGFAVISPCGGNGTCGKCTVYVKDYGHVSSCLYLVEMDIEVILPEPGQSQILMAQYKHTRQLAFDPGQLALRSSYPMGIAIDLGTTTIVFYLINLITSALIETRGVVNPLGKYGADVISRINYCIQHSEGLSRMQSELMNALQEQIDLFAHNNFFQDSEIVKITVAGNTTMLHLFAGEDPSSLAFVPFKAKFLDQQNIPARKLGLRCHPEAEVKLLPSISAYIGADIVAGLASLSPDPKITNALFLDIGTNGEIALLAGEQIYCCATAAGPAFEGANISCGMAAVQGAISAFGIPGNKQQSEKQKLEEKNLDGQEEKGFPWKNSGFIKTIADAPPRGICGSGLIDIVAFLAEKNIVDAKGLMEQDFIVYSNEDTSDSMISINQQDIREVQLAKSAIYSGLKILTKKAGLSFDEIDVLYLAGGFGNYINTQSALRIGLLPGELSEKIIPVGNASGTGAILALKSNRFEKILEEYKSRAQFVELADEEDFMMEFAMNMDLPDNDTGFGKFIAGSDYLPGKNEGKGQGSYSSNVHGKNNDDFPSQS